MSKDVIYIDIEDDITSVISKLKDSSSKIVALVPPKRATIFTSVVNLKLLKKAAADANKRVVLVTAEESLQTLAGGLGMYVAKNLTSQPAIPEAPEHPEIPSAVIQASGVERPVDPAQEKTNVTGAAATATAAAKTAGKPDTKDKKLKPLKKDKKLPDFDSFRKKLFIGGVALVLLLIGWWVAAFVLPAASIELETQQQNVSRDFTLAASTNGGSAPETNDNIDHAISGETKTIEITQTVDVNPTGEENVGDKATGTLDFENCLQSDPLTLVKGTRVRHTSGLVFVLTEAVTIPGGSFFAGSCVSSGGPSTVAVEASQPGDSYNIAGTNESEFDGDPYQVVNFDQTENDNLLINGSDMGGGTDDIVTIVQQEDVDRAIEAIAFKDDTETILSQLRERFEGEVYLFEKTLSEDTSEPDVAPSIGERADAAKATVTRTYSVVGVKQEELDEVVREALSEQVSEQQSVVDTGLGQLVVEVAQENENSIVFDMTANGTAGPEIDEATLKSDIANLPFSEAESQLEFIPGVVNARISLSPFWVSSIPGNTDKIEITIVEPQTEEQ